MGILEFLKKNRILLRKIFGEKELDIIEKQILGINLKQSEKNRLSRNIRKKFEVARLLSQFSEADLKKGSEIRKITEEVKEKILKSKYYLKIKKIILFGSSIKKQRTFRSDIDVAVEFDEIDKDESFKFRLELKRGFGDILDLQVYNTLPEKIRKEIDKEGKIIYERKNKRENRRYLDKK